MSFNQDKKIRTRFAPSPTGFLHIGNARVAVFNWLFAKKCGGSFILRMEDTDTERSKRLYEDSIIDDLTWLGLDWDEGPDKDGLCGKYRQSERLDLYKQYADSLLTAGTAYPCYCSEKRLSDLRKTQASQGRPPRYDGLCRQLNESDKPMDVLPTIRFTVPQKKIIFNDEIHGKISFNSSAFGDFIILGSDGIATYNFAVVLDDALMKITHVIRGEDHLSNTPRQILLYEALGLEIPRYAHLSLILGQDKKPLSKRLGAASIRNLREDGFLPESIFNSLCLLGWSPGKEFISREEASNIFSLKGLSKSPSIFDLTRLKRLNRHYTSKIDTGSLLKLLRPCFKGVKEDWLKDAIEAVKDEASMLTDFEALLNPFLGRVQYEANGMRVTREPYVKELLEELLKRIDKYERIDATAYRDIIIALKSFSSESGKRFYMPIRVAVTGNTHGIEMEKIFCLLGKERLKERINECIKSI